MYQTLQQRLKKFQGFVEKWSPASPQEGFEAGQSKVEREGNTLKNGPPSKREESFASVSSPHSLMAQFQLLKAVWIEDQKHIEGMNLPQYGQALNTEIHKQFRMMEVDITFLNTARQSKTITQRTKKLDDRLHKLIEYCETGIKLSQQKS